MSPPRTILYTGKGGVGKTSLAAATARHCAAAGMRTVLLSTDPAHSLSDSLGAELGPDPVELGTGLWAHEVRAGAEMERNWARVSAWLSGMLIERGVDRIRAEELTVPPGMDELFSLLTIKRHHESGRFDLIVVDCAPTGETLRLLGFPEVARWWLSRAFPWQRRLLGGAAPLARALDVPFPDPEILGEVEHLVGNLVAMDEILRDQSRCSIRLVMNPDRMVIEESKRTFTYLCLYGYLTDAVVVNRIFPEEVEGTYFDAWRRKQAEHLLAVREGFDPLPILTCRYFDDEVAGAEMLDRLAGEAFAGSDPAAVLRADPIRELRQEGEVTILRVATPFAEKDDLGLRQVGGELIVSVGDVRRTIILPSGLAGRSPARAEFKEGALEIAFGPAPEATRNGDRQSLADRTDGSRARAQTREQRPAGPG